MSGPSRTKGLPESRRRRGSLAGLLLLAAGPALADPSVSTKYLYERALISEVLLKESIVRKLGNQSASIFNSLAFEVAFLQSRTAMAGACLEALKALVPDSLLSSALVEPGRGRPR